MRSTYAMNQESILLIINDRNFNPGIVEFKFFENTVANSFTSFINNRQNQNSNYYIYIKFIPNIHATFD